MDGDLLQQLRASLDEEDAPDLGDVAKLYAEAGVVLPDMVRQRFEDVERFHRTIIENRRAHLKAEIGSAETRIDERYQRITDRDRRRRQIMSVLSSGTALEHYTNLREESGRAEADVESLRQRLETAERIESTKAELDIERANLTKTLRDDLHERDEILREAILTFEALSESLYEKAGSLTISGTGNGPHFDVHIDGQRSKGITNMQIFCFDLMLTEISLRRKPPVKLSITHKSVESEHGAQFYVGQAGEASPHDHVSWWWVAGSGEITAKASDFDQVRIERLLRFMRRWLVGDQTVEQDSLVLGQGDTGICVRR